MFTRKRQVPTMRTSIGDVFAGVERGPYFLFGVDSRGKGTDIRGQTKTAGQNNRLRGWSQKGDLAAS